MEHGLNLEGFNNTRPAGTNNVAPEQYAAAPSKNFSAEDKSSQGAAGVTNKMVHSVEETRNFGSGN
jgi:hypothetical protein